MTTASTAFRDNLVRHARAYVHRGLALTPIEPGGKRPYLKAWGKRPLRTIEQIETHWANHPDDNVGLILGPLSGVIDIEDDTPEATIALEWLLSDQDKQTPTYRSGKSTHRLYRLPEGITDNVLAVDGIELRCGLDGQSQSVLPPSLHPSGRYYAWVPGLALWQVELQPCPRDVIEYIGERIAIREEGCGTIQVFNTVLRTEGSQFCEASNVIVLPAGDRPGDVYNQLARWEDVLEPAGWKKAGMKGDLQLWIHPDSESGSHSAATGWKTAAGNDVLVVYSNRTKFQSVLDSEKRVYTRFEAYAILNHGGDRTKAAAKLAELGYKPAVMENINEVVDNFCRQGAVA